jgi:hypothetical protein
MSASVAPGRLVDREVGSHRRRTARDEEARAAVWFDLADAKRLEPEA